MRIYLTFLFQFVFWISFSQSTDGNFLNIVTYNVENLFDIEIDSTTNYGEFNPEKQKKWDSYKYRQKINALAKSIASISDSLPEFIGLVEVENKNVCLQLIAHPLLKKANYEIIHFDSPDHRGIDVAFLYQKQHFNLLAFKAINASGGKRQTRDILAITGIFKDTGDTLSFWINHWTSRYGGKKSSESGRLELSEILKTNLDSIQHQIPSCSIIAMGDFNDNPKDVSMKNLVDSGKYVNVLQDSSFEIGSLKYRQSWQVYDQFILSKNLFEPTSLRFHSVHIHSNSWLLEADEKHGGLKPYRTYIGPKYHGGVSDHLPVVLILEY